MDPRAVLAEVDEEILLTLKEFSSLFDRGLAGLRRSVSRGTLKEARKIANRWYVLVPSRIVRAVSNKSRIA